MRFSKALLAGVLSLWAPCAQAAIAHVQTTQKNGLSTSTTIVTPSITVTAGNLLVASCLGWNQPTLSTLQLDGTTNFTIDVNVVNTTTTNYRHVIGHLENVSGGSHSATLTWTAAAGDGNCWLSEFSGAATASAADGASTLNGGTGTAFSSGTFSATSGQTTDLFIGLVGDDSGVNTDTLTAGTNYTLAGTAVTTGLTNSVSAVAYRIQTSLSSDAVVWTSSVSRQWTAVGVAYKEPAAAGGCTPTLALLGVGRCGD